MIVPLSDARLTAIRELGFLDGAFTELDRTAAAIAATRELVREVDRLRAELATAHADALNRGAAVLDHLADTAEAKVLTHYNGACGKGSCDLVRESARTLRDMADTHTAPTT